VGASAFDAFQNLSLHSTHASLVSQPLPTVTTMEDQQAADDAQEVQVLAEEG